MLPYEASTALSPFSCNFKYKSNRNFYGWQRLNGVKQKHFDPDTYVYREGQFLTYSALDATSDGEGLLGRTSETNPNGMNPKVGSRFKTDAGEKKKLLLPM